MTIYRQARPEERNEYVDLANHTFGFDIEELLPNYICLFNYLFISSQMSAKPYFIGSTGILLLW